MHENREEEFRLLRRLTGNVCMDKGTNKETGERERLVKRGKERNI